MKMNTAISAVRVLGCSVVLKKQITISSARGILRISAATKNSPSTLSLTKHGEGVSWNLTLLSEALFRGNANSSTQAQLLQGNACQRTCKGTISQLQDHSNAQVLFFSWKGHFLAKDICVDSFKACTTSNHCKMQLLAKLWYMKGSYKHFVFTEHLLSWYIYIYFFFASGQSHRADRQISNAVSTEEMNRE